MSVIDSILYSFCINTNLLKFRIIWKKYKKARTICQNVILLFDNLSPLRIVYLRLSKGLVEKNGWIWGLGIITLQTVEGLEIAD